MNPDLDTVLRRMEPFVQQLANRYGITGGDRDDVAQHARIGVLKAVRTYRPERGANINTFARLCAEREVQTAVKQANAGKHAPLSASTRLELPTGAHDEPLANVIPSRAPTPEETVTAREDLHELIDRANALTRLERVAIVGRIHHIPMTETARLADTNVKAIDNARSRAVRKLAA